MGCCQNPPNHPNNRSITTEQVRKEVDKNESEPEDPIDINDHNQNEIEIPQEILKGLSQKQKYVLMIIDKSAIDVQLLVAKGNTKEALFFFTRKLLFENFLKKIDHFLRSSEPKGKISDREEIENMGAFLDDISTCSMINYTAVEFQKLSTEQQSLVFQDFANFFDRYLQTRPREVETLFQEYSTNFLRNKESSPLFQK